MAEHRQSIEEQKQDAQLVAKTFQKLFASMLQKGLDRHTVIVGLLGAAIRELHALKGDPTVTAWLRAVASTLEAQNKPPESASADRSR